MFNDIYKGKKVLVTGSTGFKGSWITLWLQKLGADVTGYSLPPASDPSHYRLLNLPRTTMWMDLMNYEILERVIWIGKPEIVFHLAASAIVAKTFDDPRGTFINNVIGAVNVLEACRHTPSVKAIVMITTDKVYANKEWGWGYRENDELGGLDPYSASKVCVEHVIECYRNQFLPFIATARAGNVIGGGDWAYKRLIPDIVRATAEGRPVEVHTPNATRPWQHVLEPLAGYLTLGQKLILGHPGAADRWNFGPTGEMTVLQVLEVAKEVWPKIEYVVKEEETHPSMVELLKIDSSRAKKELGWRPVWTMKEAIKNTISWYRDYYEGGNVTSMTDILAYETEMKYGGKK